MNDNTTASESAIPEFCDWSIAAVRLLQGVVYSDDARAWNLVLANQSQLQEYVGRLGLLLAIDEGEGFAYLRQPETDDYPEGYEDLPRLFRRSRLGYGPTLLCVLLRDALHKFEEEDVDNERCVVETSSLLDEWKAFFPPEHDEVRQSKEFAAALRKIEELSFIKKFTDDPQAWEIRRILKARLPAAELTNLKQQLTSAQTLEK